MTTMNLWTALILGVVAVGAPCQSSKAKKKPPTTGSEGLIYAAANCDLPTLKTILASGVNVSATDAEGYDALSRASLERNLKNPTRNWWTLKCPAAVVALTEAGADPWKARFYQNPRIEQKRPKMIAVIRVGDNRQTKGDSSNIMQEMTDAIEYQLHVSHINHLGYPILPLSEARQKMLASGFSAEDAVAPDRLKACKALDADSVIEASLEDYASKSIGIASAARMRMTFALTDCKTGDLLWRSDQDYAMAEGWLVRGLMGKIIRQKITGSVTPPPAIAFPVSEERIK